MNFKELLHSMPEGLRIAILLTITLILYVMNSPFVWIGLAGLIIYGCFFTIATIKLPRKFKRSEESKLSIGESAVLIGVILVWSFLLYVISKLI
jgi:ABC-type bacteriocin/lantibiotic exporter with double-glycine peptidase domain